MENYEESTGDFMGISAFGIGTSARSKGSTTTIFAGNLSMFHNPRLKSTQEKLERQQNAANQIEYWENQKENLKNVQCETVEEIAKKLEKFRSYDDQISAVRMQFNNEQMQHIMDEAREIGEKIAKEAKKLEPKTPEERREEMVKEALGIDDHEGLLEESMEEIEEIVDETVEELTEELTEKTAEVITEELEKEMTSQTADSITKQTLEAEKQSIIYKRIDFYA